MNSNFGLVLRQFGELSGARTDLEQGLQIGEGYPSDPTTHHGLPAQ
jgi:hypothetical protein